MFGYDDVMHREADHPAESRAAALQQNGQVASDFWLEQPGVLLIVEGEMDKLACNGVRLHARS